MLMDLIGRLDSVELVVLHFFCDGVSTSQRSLDEHARPDHSLHFWHGLFSHLGSDGCAQRKNLRIVVQRDFFTVFTCDRTEVVGVGGLHAICIELWCTVGIGVADHCKHADINQLAGLYLFELLNQHLTRRG